ncbi:MAG: DUF402 domain-containing protein [Erysipelotrichaceae bacterium]
MNLKIKDRVYIQSYKHDGSLHRTWSMGFVIETNEKQLVIVTESSNVVESNGRIWCTKEPAICFFYPDRWYNVIAMIRKSGVYYYCNLASPIVVDQEAVKNIDYDLDVKVFPNQDYIILDEDEYLDHSKKMNYPKSIKDIVENELDVLIEKIKAKDDPFNETIIYKYYYLYEQLLKEDAKNK